jgi:hypothetical protein
MTAFQPKFQMTSLLLLGLLTFPSIVVGQQVVPTDPANAAMNQCLAGNATGPITSQLNQPISGGEFTFYGAGGTGACGQNSGAVGTLFMHSLIRGLSYFSSNDQTDQEGSSQKTIIFNSAGNVGGCLWLPVHSQQRCEMGTAMQRRLPVCSPGRRLHWQMRANHLHMPKLHQPKNVILNTKYLNSSIF